MGKATTPSFILELELRLDSHQKATLTKKLNVARQIYNACLNRSLKCLHSVLADPEYRDLLKQEKSDERKTKLKDIEYRYGYSANSLRMWVLECRHYFGKQIGSTEAQQLAARAFYAVEKVHYHQAKKVNFVAYGNLVTTENNNNNSNLRWTGGRVVWNDLSMDVIVKKNDFYAQACLQYRTKYVRIIAKDIRGRRRYFAQLVQEGIPPQKKNCVVGPMDARVGIDPGTGTMAIVSKDHVELVELAPSLQTDESKLRHIQRAMDRSRRAMNPDNYNADGTIKKGRKTWVYSNRYKKLEAKYKELHRKVAAKRKQSHEELANRVIALGLDVRTEEMSYKGLQKRSKKTTKNKKNGKINKKKRFGKSIGNRAPAKFLTILDRKLQYYGSSLKKVDTKKLKASQFDHTTGKYTKEALKDRWNDIQGHRVQRDLYSAFLIAYTRQNLCAVNIKLAKEEFEHFLALHDAEVERLRHAGFSTLKWYVR